ncbi:tetratricopeptide repeat protein [bacterium]|jgi:tetratricopeptide (TPR) repeat protein|nr:tetratricopeptide repeat protein [bacterium]MBR4820529.1 tetratricopeptide repeat protein [bacterium]
MLKRIKITFLLVFCASALLAASYDEKAGEAFNSGLACVRSNDFRSAMRAFRQATQYDASFAAAYLNIAACHERLGEFAKARPFYEKALKLDGDNANFAFIYAGALFRHGEVFEGKKYLERAVYADPANPDYVYELGVMCLCLTQKVEAAKCFRAAVDVSTNYSAAWFRLGALELEGGKTNESLRLLEKVELDCDLAPQAYLLKSRLRKKMGDLDKAESDVRMALKLSKGYDDAYLTLAQILREKKNYREACELLERVELKSSRGNWSLMLARLYEEWGDEMLAAGEAETAKTLYRQGLRFLPEDPSLLGKSGSQSGSK